MSGSEGAPATAMPPTPPTPSYVEPVPWRRLDARMLLVHPVRELARFLPALVGVFVLGTANDHSSWEVIGVALPIALGVLRFLTTTYRITPLQVELRRGLLGRSVLTARLDRVRAVELTASPIHRVLGLAKVEIGTGSTARQDDEKFVLDALAREPARELRAALLHRTGRAAPAGEAGAADDVDAEGPGDGAGTGVGVGTSPAVGEDVVLLAVDPRWVRYAPLTSSGNVIAAGLLATLGQFSDRIGRLLFQDTSVASQVRQVPVAVLVVLAVASFLVLGAIFAVGGYLVTNWRFTLSLDAQGRSFHVRRGLLTSTETSLERRRVRGLEVSEHLALRVVGGARLSAIVTGISAKEAGRTQLVPPAPREVVDRTGAVVIGRTEPLHLPLTGHGSAARRRRYTRAVLGASVLPLLVALLCLTTPLPRWTLLPALLPVLVALPLAADRYRRLGHALDEQYLVVRSGSLRGRRDLLQRDGIIGWNVRQSFFQRRAGLATLVATTAAGKQAYAAYDVPVAEAVALADAAVPGLVSPFLV